MTNVMRIFMTMMFDFETMNAFQVKWCTLKYLHADVCFVRKVLLGVSVDI